MHTSQLTDETLRSLSQLEADEPVIVSMFIDLEPALFATPRARETQFNSLLSELDEKIRDPELSRDAKEALAADRARIETYLTEEFDGSEARALVVYSALALDVFQVIKLADPVEPGVHVDLWPVLETVMGQEDEGTWCVLLV